MYYPEEPDFLQTDIMILLPMNFTRVSKCLPIMSGDIDDPNPNDVAKIPESESSSNVINMAKQQSSFQSYSQLTPSKMHSRQKQHTQRQKKILKQNEVVKLLTIDQIIQMVQNETIATRCLRSGTQSFTKGLRLFHCVGGGVDLILKTNYGITKDGSIEFINQNLLKKQKGVLGFLLKQLGAALLTGKSLGNISLPVSIFEPRSLLERNSSQLSYAPQMIGRAAKLTSALDQFRHTVAHYAASIHVEMVPEKPFNPILGETFQGIIGGCPIYAEQISHHPPISAYQMLGDGFTIHGTKEFHAALSTNSVKTKEYGLQYVNYSNTSNQIIIQYPQAYISGTAFGKRTIQYVGKFIIFDLKNNLYSEIDFESKKKKANKSYFAGSIWKMNQTFRDKLYEEYTKKKDIDISFKESKHAQEKYDDIEGDWLEYVQIGNSEYWRYGKEWPHVLQYFDTPLPSDCNYRLDILYLKKGDENKAQEYKTILEEQQRRDKKLREELAKKRKK